MWHYAKEQDKFGPVGEDELLGLIRAGTLADHNLVWREGMTEWQPISEVMEIQRALFAARAVPASAVAASAVAAPPSNGMAITSMVLGIVSLVAGTLILTGLPAVICGHIARRQIRESPAAQSGDGMAIAGLITGYISIFFTIGFVILIVALFASV